MKTLYMEDLKGYQRPTGNRTLSWNMSTDLWSKVLDTTKHMRQVLGHPYGGSGQSTQHGPPVSVMRAGREASV